MTNEQILEQQVEALEKLLKLKQAVVDELEAKVNRLQNPYGGIPGINTPYYPYNQPIYGCGGGGSGQGNAGGGAGITITSCQHEYPSMWGGTGNPPCIKCGHQFGYAGNSGSIIIGNGTTNSGAAGGLSFTASALQDLVNSSAK